MEIILGISKQNVCLVLMFVYMWKAFAITTLNLYTTIGYSMSNLNQFSIICDFNINEALINYYGANPSAYQTRIFRNGSIHNNTLITQSYKLGNHPLNNDTYSRYFSIDYQSYLHYYSGNTLQ